MSCLLRTHESKKAQWPYGQCARRAIAKAKHRSQWSVIRWVTKKLLRASEGTLSRWSRFHLQSLAPTPFQEGLTSGRRPVVKIIAKSVSQHDKKYVVPTSLSGIRVGRRKRRRSKREVRILLIITLDYWTT
jgi:hypothetical protein